MPIVVKVGHAKQDRKSKAAVKMLKNNGAWKTEVHKDKQEWYVLGIFKGMADPNKAKADLLMDALTVDMGHNTEFQGLWVDDMFGVDKWPVPVS